MSRNAIADDLGRHMQQQIGDVIKRNVAAAQIVLPQPDLALMLIQAAVSTVLTAVASCTSMMPEENRPDFFDATVDMIAQLARSDRERSLLAIANSAARSSQ